PQRPAAVEVELPPMPRAREHRRLVVHVHRSRRGTLQLAAHDAEAHGPRLVRAAVVHRVEAIAPAQDADLPPAGRDDAEAPIVEIADRADVDDQVAFAAPPWRAGDIASRSHPYSAHAFSKKMRSCHSAGRRDER